MPKNKSIILYDFLLVKGGVEETVVDQQTGLLCPADPGIKDIIDNVTLMSPEYALSLKTNCQQRAQRFSATLFIEKMQQLMDSDNAGLLTIAERVSVP